MATYKQLLDDLKAIEEDNPKALEGTVCALIADEQHHLELVTTLNQDRIMLVPVFINGSDEG